MTLKIESFSGTKFPGWFFIVQGCAIAAWWFYLVAYPARRQVFVPPGASEVELLAFWLPDLVMVFPLSLAAGLAFLGRFRCSHLLAWAAAGAVNYAFLYCTAWSLLRQGGWTSVLFMAPAAFFSGVAALDASASTITIFRRSSADSPLHYVIATLVQMALFWFGFLLVMPLAIKFVETRLGWPPMAFVGQHPIALILLLLFSALGLKCGMTMAVRGAGTPLPFAAPNRLVVAGLYAYLRNPMVICGLGQGIAVALWMASWAVGAYVFIGGLVWHFLIRPAEERDLAQLFGADYACYCRQVRCWVPRLHAYRPRA